MEQFTYNDLNAIKQFSTTKDKMNHYLDFALNILNKELTEYEYEKILNLNQEEFIVQFKLDSTEVNLGFTWSDDINIAIEIHIDPHLVKEDYIIKNGWLFEIYNHHEALFFKYKHLKELIIPMKQLDQEFRIQDFIETACFELIEALRVKSNNGDEK